MPIDAININVMINIDKTLHRIVRAEGLLSRKIFKLLTSVNVFVIFVGILKIAKMLIFSPWIINPHGTGVKLISVCRCRD